jgi:hypothetical protein
VTLPHIPESADACRLDGRQLPVADAQITAREDVAFLRWPGEPEGAEPALGSPVPGQSCQVAVVGDHDPTVRLRAGTIGAYGDQGRFTVELDGILGEDETASGSPVVVDGHVAGIVGPTATNRSLDAITVERVFGTIPLPEPSPEVELSDSATLALTYALAILRSSTGPRVTQTPGSAALLGAMRYTAERGRRTVADGLVGLAVERRDRDAELTDRDVVDRLAMALGRDLPVYPAKGESVRALMDSPLAPLIGQAEVVRQTYGGPPEIHLRHVLVAALIRSPLPSALFEELRSSPEELRNTVRAGIEELAPREPQLAAALVVDSVELAGGISEDLVDPTQALKLSQDHVGVRHFVSMFATLIARRDTPVPLSIGLFGEWGSGKSYFMALLRGEIDRLSRTGDPPYYGEIRQIGFNAWTYADSNLWASLGDEIFAQLAGPSESDAHRRRRLETELSDGLQRRLELAAATERATAETARLSRDIKAATVERGVRGRDLRAALTGELGTQAETAFKRLGIETQAEQGRLLADELRSAPADIDVLRRSLTSPFGIALAVLAGLLLVAIVVALAASREWLAGVGSVALFAVIGAAGRAVRQARSGVSALHRIADGVRAAAASDDRIKVKLGELRAAETQEKVLRAQRDEVVAQVDELRRELAELTPGQRLYSFVAERAASDAYRGQLGLISTIRKDLIRLVALMGAWDGDPKAPRPIERIVLYIDDLDRCSPQQVVQVLQAVHLLLALDLFVVVVGVDPRWLLRALRGEYRAMLTGEATGADEDEWWQTTPQDYLEKIFNIPFALPRMSTKSFDQLIRELAKPKPDQTAAGDPPSSATAGTADEDDAIAEAPAPESEPPPEPAELIVPDAGSEVASSRSGDAPPVETLQLSEPELKLLSSLAPLVETPREAKRMLNLYRMIRSTKNLTPAGPFLGSEDQPGDYQAVVILLGLLSGHARRLEDVLVAAPGDDCAGGLRHRDSGESWADFVAGMAPQPNGANAIVGARAADDLAGWQRLAEGLAPATELVKKDLQPFQRWAPLISRFSFLLSPYAGHEEDEL